MPSAKTICSSKPRTSAPLATAAWIGNSFVGISTPSRRARKLLGRSPSGADNEALAPGGRRSSSIAGAVAGDPAARGVKADPDGGRHGVEHRAELAGAVAVAALAVAQRLAEPLGLRPPVFLLGLAVGDVDAHPDQPPRPAVRARDHPAPVQHPAHAPAGFDPPELDLVRFQARESGVDRAADQVQVVGVNTGPERLAGLFGKAPRPRRPPARGGRSRRPTPRRPSRPRPAPERANHGRHPPVEGVRPGPTWTSPRPVSLRNRPGAAMRCVVLREKENTALFRIPSETSRNFRNGSSIEIDFLSTDARVYQVPGTSRPQGACGNELGHRGLLRENDTCPRLALVYDDDGDLGRVVGAPWPVVRTILSGGVCWRRTRLSRQVLPPGPVNHHRLFRDDQPSGKRGVQAMTSRRSGRAVAGMVATLAVAAVVVAMSVGPSISTAWGQAAAGKAARRVREADKKNAGLGDPLAGKAKERAPLGEPGAAGTYHYRLKIEAGDGVTLAASYYPAKPDTATPVVLLVHEKDRSAKDFEEPITDLKGQGLAAAPARPRLRRLLVRPPRPRRQRPQAHHRP